MSEMTYKQAIKILSEAKVADMPYNGCGNNHKMYDIARRMAIAALKEKSAIEEYDESVKDTDAKPIVKIGDTIYVLTEDAPNEIEITKIKSVRRVIVDEDETFRYNAPCINDDFGVGANWTFYDKDFGVTVFTNPEEAAKMRKKNWDSNKFIVPFQAGDVIPFKTSNGHVIHYIVEKIKKSDNGIVKIRCKHGGGGQPRSFLVSEARKLVQTRGAQIR